MITGTCITGMLAEASGRFTRQLAEGHPLNKITGETKCDPSPAQQNFNRERLALTSNIALKQGLVELGYSPANAPIPFHQSGGSGPPRVAPAPAHQIDGGGERAP